MLTTFVQPAVGAPDRREAHDVWCADLRLRGAELVFQAHRRRQLERRGARGVYHRVADVRIEIRRARSSTGNVCGVAPLRHDGRHNERAAVGLTTPVPNWLLNRNEAGQLRSTRRDGPADETRVCVRDRGGDRVPGRDHRLLRRAALHLHVAERRLEPALGEAILQLGGVRLGLERRVHRGVGSGRGRVALEVIELRRGGGRADERARRGARPARGADRDGNRDADDQHDRHHHDALAKSPDPPPHCKPPLARTIQRSRLQSGARPGGQDNIE